MKSLRKLLVILLIICSMCPLLFASGSAESGKQTIQIWLGWPALQDIFNRVKADYEAAHPNVELEITAMNLRDFEQKLAVSLPTGTGPDIFITSEYIVPMYINAGLVSTPPDEIVDFVEENFDELAKSVNYFQGPNDSEPRIYGVPHIGIARVQYFNKDIMSQAGLEPVAPTTWDEQFDIAQKTTLYDSNGAISRSGMSLRIFGGGSGVGEKFMIKLVQAGGSFLGRTEDGKWKAAYNTEEGIDAFEYYIDALYKYKVDSFEAQKDTEAFVNGLTTMYDRELFPIITIKETAPDLDFGTAPMPGKVYRGTVYSTESYFVTESSKNKELAWDVIMFLQNEEYVKAFLVEEGWIPPRIDIDFSDIFAQYPEFKAAYEFPEGYRLWLYPPLVNSDEIITKFADGLVEAWRDSSLVDNREGMKAVLTKLEAETNSILDKAGLLGEGPVVRPGDVIEAPRNLGYKF